jgi:hypothetical protein
MKGQFMNAESYWRLFRGIGKYTGILAGAFVALMALGRIIQDPSHFGSETKDFPFVFAEVLLVCFLATSLVVDIAVTILMAIGLFLVAKLKDAWDNSRSRA